MGRSPLWFGLRLQLLYVDNLILIVHYNRIPRLADSAIKNN